jgi:hypothetical protein
VPGGEEFSFHFCAQAGAQIWLPALLIPGQGVGDGLGKGPAAKAAPFRPATVASPRMTTGSAGVADQARFTMA